MKASVFLSALSIVPLALLPLVGAHGVIDSIAIDGKKYQGPTAGGNPIKDSPIRQISTASPVKGANNQAMTCGPDAKLASFVAPANPGSTIDVLWSANDRSHWPHNTGPMEVYLASCGSTSCDKFDASNAQWFKISEVGKTNNGWAQQDQFNGKAHSFQLPPTLAAGGYLLRHEIIALHLSNQPGGAEFYPGCAQIKVGGNQSGAPSANELVRFPGAYKDDDAGILVDAFNNAAYKFPGPAVSKLASKSSDNDVGSSPSKTADVPQPTPSVPPTDGDTDGSDEQGDDDCNGSDPHSEDETDSEDCDSEENDDYNGSDFHAEDETDSEDCDSEENDDSNDSNSPAYKPRHVSRVMARLFNPHSH